MNAKVNMFFTLMRPSSPFFYEKPGHMKFHYFYCQAQPSGLKPQLRLSSFIIIISVRPAIWKCIITRLGSSLGSSTGYL